MKKLYLFLGILLFCGSILSAQSPQNRTNKTIAVDVAAQMPAAKPAEYNQLMKELMASGEEGILQLIGMMNAPGKGSNASVEYALSGLTYYVMAQGEETARLTTSQAYVNALNKTTDREISAFIIRQLEITGKDECVNKLSDFLQDVSLCGPASRALAAIGTEKAGKALAQALQSATDPTVKRDLIQAIGDARVSGTEELLSTFLNDTDPKLQQSLMYALSRTGTKASLKTLAAKAEQSGYTMDKTGATEGYISLIRNLLNAGEVKEAESASTELWKKAGKAGVVSTQGAALAIMFAANPQKAEKNLISALKDPNREYRNAALSNVSSYTGENVYKAVFTAAEKAKPEVKADILNWFSEEINCPRKKEIITAIPPVKGQSLLSFLIKEAGNENLMTRRAAVETLTTWGNPAAIPVLAGLLTSSDKEIIGLGRQSLATFNGDITPEVVKTLSSPISDEGKIAGLELLAGRKSFSNLNVVLTQLKEGSANVKSAAYAALKEVVSEKDLSMLFQLLESGDPQYVPALQQAVIKTLPGTDPLKQVTRQMERSEKKYLYYPVLPATGDPGALSIIVNGLENGTGMEKDAAFEALLISTGPEVPDYLLALYKEPSASKYADRALNSYIKLVSAPSLTGENQLIRLREAMEIAKTNDQKNTILQRIGKTGTFPGLLYAGKFLDTRALQQAAAHAVMNIALEHKEYTGTHVEKSLIQVMSVLDNPDAAYQKEAIRKHLSEMPEEEGFISLFNGKDLTGWKGLVGNPLTRAKMSSAQLAKAQQKADEQMRKDWKAENGLLVFDGKGYDNICSEKNYGDIEMYIDWKLDPAGPEADAGIYLRGTPQVQIWDTARTNVGAQVGSGGLYNNQKNPSIPLKVADNKLGEWNTFYIKMVGDRVTVKLNGETVTDNVILENFWDRNQPIFPEEQLELQAHGSKVYYRDIYVKELPRPEPFKLSPEEKKEGYHLLFDGTNMHEWTGNTADYILEDGCISLHPSNKHGGNLYTKKEYGNFIFRFEFQLTPGANNGLGIRTPMEGDAAYVGMELQILDDDAPVYKDLQPYQYHGSIYGIIASERGHLKPPGEWNYQEVIANGDDIKITLNGTVIVDGNLREATKNGTPDKQEHPGLFNKKGHIGFLGHGSPVKFRNIRIKELK